MGAIPATEVADPADYLGGEASFTATMAGGETAEDGNPTDGQVAGAASGERWSRLRPPKSPTRPGTERKWRRWEKKEGAVGTAEVVRLGDPQGEEPAFVAEVGVRVKPPRSPTRPTPESRGGVACVAGQYRNHRSRQPGRRPGLRSGVERERWRGANSRKSPTRPTSRPEEVAFKAKMRGGGNPGSRVAAAEGKVAASRGKMDPNETAEVANPPDHSGYGAALRGKMVGGAASGEKRGRPKPPKSPNPADSLSKTAEFGTKAGARGAAEVAGPPKT